MYDLLQVMQQDGYLSSVELLALRKTCKELGENPVRVLRSLNIASPEQIQDYLQRYFRVNALGEQALAMLDETYQSYVPIDLAIHFSCFGLGEELNILYVAMEDPSDRGAIQQLRFYLNKRIIAVSATVFQLSEALSKIYRVNKSALNLTTVIEKSRGVVGGIRYEVSHRAEAISIGDDFAGANLSDSVSDDVDSFVSKSPENSLPAPENKVSGAEPSAEISVSSTENAQENMPTVGFIDGSSGDVEQSLLTPNETENQEPPEASAAPLTEEAKVVEPPPPLETSSEEISDSTMIGESEAPSQETLGENELLSEETELEADDSPPKEKVYETPSESMTVQLSSLASSALVKLSLLENKDQALEMINMLLKPFSASVTLGDGEKYLIEGEDFSVTGDMSSSINMEESPVAFAIEPILKRVMKMKNLS